MPQEFATEECSDDDYTDAPFTVDDLGSFESTDFFSLGVEALD